MARPARARIVTANAGPREVWGMVQPGQVLETGDGTALINDAIISWPAGTGAYVYDGSDRLSTFTYTLASGVVFRVETYTYDASDRVSTLVIQLYGSDGALDSTHTLTYSYDASDKVTTVTHAYVNAS